MSEVYMAGRRGGQTGGATRSRLPGGSGTGPVTAGSATAWIPETLADGFAALNAGLPERAAEHCRRILEAAPELAEAHFLVGLAALAMNDRRTAVSAFGSVTRLRPGHGAAWAQLAQLFMQAGQANRADRALTEAMNHAGADPVVQDLIGLVWSLMGDQSRACEWYARAVAGAPDVVGFRVNLANALTFLGRTSEARAQLGRVLRQAPETPQAHWLLSGIGKAADRRHVEELVRLIARGGRAPRQQAFLYYALGKELEDLEEWPRAFAAFARGAALRRRTVEFDEDREQAVYDTLTRLFTQSWLQDRRRATPVGVPGPAPIFVVGQPRTGTTLVERIISAHSQVQSAGELQQFGLSVRRLVGYQGVERFSPQLLTEAAELDGPTLGRAYLTATARLRGPAARFVDKLPSNFLYLPLILKALPRARIVHVVRAPMDACFASFKQLFADAYPHSYDQAEMARHFVRYNRLMAVWRERFGEHFVDVRYEDVVNETETQARRLLEHLTLPWEDGCLEFHRQPGAVATASAVQVREPAHTRSVGRWRRYAAELAPMQRVLQDAEIDLD